MLLLSITVSLVITLTIFTLLLSRDITKMMGNTLTKDNEVLLEATYNNVDIAYHDNLTIVRNNLNVAELFLNGRLVRNEEKLQTVEIKNQLTKETILSRIGSFYFNGKELISSSEIVDNIVKEVGGTATILYMLPEGLLRISTTVKDEFGNRAIYTYIPNTSPVYSAIAKGKEYTGLALVMDKWLFTGYRPLFDENRKVIGAIYVGLSENVYSALRKKILSLQVGENSYYSSKNGGKKYL
jgi:methyl-accepting chemotaxis protein